MSPLARIGCVASLLAAGCGSAPFSDEAQTRESLSPSTNDKIAFDYFLGKGLTNFQVAGIVGNLDQESNVDPTAAQSGGPGRGIAQWSVGGRWDTTANDNVVAYASAHGESPTSLDLQLDFIWYELQTFSDYGLAGLLQTTTVTDATIAFETNFEGCGSCDQSARVSDAEAALKAYGADDAGASAGAKDGGASASGDDASLGDVDGSGGGGGTSRADAGSSNAGGAHPDVPESSDRNGGCATARTSTRGGADWTLGAAVVVLVARARRRRFSAASAARPRC